MPLDIVADAPLASPPRGRRARAARPARPRRRGAGEPLVQREQLVRRRPVGEAEQLREVAERAVRRQRAGRRAGDLGPPGVGRTRPQAIFTSVDLPAPLGPSRPNSSPSPTSRSTPAQRLGAPVALAQVGDGEGGRHAVALASERWRRDCTESPPPLHWDGRTLHILDQTRLPAEEVVLELPAPRHGRGDQAARGARRAADRGRRRLRPRDGARARRRSPEALERAAARLAGARPTARNLGWAVERVAAAALAAPDRLAEAAREAAEQIHREDEAASAALARHGADALEAALPDGRSRS